MVARDGVLHTCAYILGTVELDLAGWGCALQ
jgi:hypothetical protein